MIELFATKKVLVADDSSLVRQIIRSELTEMGFLGRRIKEVADGQKALALLQAERFDLVVSDWKMPRLDGLGLLKEIKSSRDLSHILFLMVSAESEKQQIAEALELGADQYVTKPFSKTVFRHTVKNLLVEQTTFEDKKALVIDDSSTARMIVANNLRQAGFKEENIRQAPDGEDAINQLCGESVDIVITDWHMPKMDGLEFVKRIRAHSALKHIPILMVTAEIEKDKVLRAIHAGATEYILKPFNALELQHKIKRTFEL
ncbi:response regulator [Thermodesulfobacteriota bacterium]